MKENHLNLIKMIANSKHKEKMAKRAMEKAESRAQFYCSQLKKAGFISGIYEVDGVIAEYELYSNSIKVAEIKVRK